MSEPVAFKRNIGLFLATMIGIGAMMGPGVFALPGELAHIVGQGSGCQLAEAAVLSFRNVFSHSVRRWSRRRVGEDRRPATRMYCSRLRFSSKEITGYGDVGLVCHDTSRLLWERSPTEKAPITNGLRDHRLSLPFPWSDHEPRLPARDRRILRTVAVPGEAMILFGP